MAGIPERNALVDSFLAARPDNRLRIHGRAPAQLYQELADGMIEVAINLEVAGSGASRSAVETGMADELDRKSTRLNSSQSCASRMPSSACKKKQHDSKRDKTDTH